MPGADDPQLLLVDADSRAPTLPRGAPILGAAAQPVLRGAPSGFLWDELAAPNDLERQRWAVIAPEGPEGDALIDRVRPLIDLRQRQQHAPVRIYRAPPDQSAEAAARWKKQVFGASERHRDDLARYQLIVGDLHQISPDLQVIQATDGFVGRLAFDRLEDYTAYVDKLLAAERAPPPTGLRAVFHAVDDGTSATTIGQRSLIGPSLELARDLQSRGGASFPAEIVDGPAGAPDPNRLLALARAALPTALFTVSHGAGAPRGGWRSAAEQRARQGAMSFAAAGELAGADLASAAFLPGGVWFMLACFSAGTPATSKYQRWLAALAQQKLPGDPDAALRSLPVAGARPFVAALPKALLANPRGPLAFVGHLDLAWTYSFRELDSGRAQNRPGRFVQTLTSLVRGHRVGAAFRELFRYFEQTNTELTTLDEADQSAPLRRAHLWMLRQDLAGYVVLGDPAVHLPAAARPQASAPAPRPVASLDVGDFLGVTVLPPTPAAQPAAPSLAALEQAIGHLLIGELTPQQIAERHGIDRATLEDLAARYRQAGRAAIER